MAKELDSGKLMYSGGNNDECYTPAYVSNLFLNTFQRVQ